MKNRADLILTNGKVYSLDENFSISQAFAVRDGRFLETGSSKAILEKYSAESVIDAHGASVFPGFIDAHCHFYGYALGLNQVDLTGVRSWDEVIGILVKSVSSIVGDWIVGRGWDQNLWKDKRFPDKSKLDSAFPGRPVVLSRIDGHAVIANAEALKRAGIGVNHHFNPQEVEVKNGILTGILTEDAADQMKNTIPVPDNPGKVSLLRKAQSNCFAAGLTSVADAGLERSAVLLLDSLQKQGSLQMRIYAMLSPTDENISGFVTKGKYKTDRLDVRSIKLYADGSLGSRTALMKKPYSDARSLSGISVTATGKILEICTLALKYGYQVNTHAIGDSACKLVLITYGAVLKGKNDLRWRIEHAQVVDPGDFELFGKYCVIPSVQATHATSDMKWAGDRLGPDRLKGAYAYKDLMDQNGWIANGTDFPIERINPLYTFYAAVARKDLEGYPEGGFQPENALTRKDALRSITIWAAKACFEEEEKGSIEPGKFADFVILNKDIMECSEKELPEVKILSTYSGGAKVY